MKVNCPMCDSTLIADEGAREMRCPYCNARVAVRRPFPAVERSVDDFASRVPSYTAYNGALPYVFVSYAHKNADVAVRIINGLQAAGCRVWYDAGIEAGTEWPDYIAERLDGASCVLALLSEDAIKSKNCRQEIEYAVSEEKPMLVAFLDEAKLTGGLRLRLSLVQAIYRSRFLSERAFIDEIVNARVLSGCR